jgi:imidazolonepropionase-like amidohydrolase
MGISMSISKISLAIFAFSTAAFLLSPMPADAAKKKKKVKQAAYVEVNKNPYPSTYEAMPSVLTAIINASIYTGTGTEILGGTIILDGGKIIAVGKNSKVPKNARVIDAKGKWVTPGIIDVHSHLGVYASPGGSSLSDGNEATRPDTSYVWAEHSVWPQDAGFSRALMGGVTTMQILPGSANLFGGRSVVLKNVPARTVEAMKFPDAPYGLKMACGENPKRVYGKKGGPSTRMGNMYGYRKSWIDATAYKKKWDKYKTAYKAGKDVSAPKQDLRLDTLMGVLEGEIRVHNHCYRADEIVTMINLSHEFGYKIGSFQHVVEGYKVADYLKKNNICAAMWADWWGFKLESFDGIDENVAMVANAGACAIVHSDDAYGIQRLNQEAAKAWADGRKAGIKQTKAEAFKWLTLNAAISLGLDKKIGSLEVGKNADVVIWSANPLSVYAVTEYVFIDGAVLYEKGNAATYSQSDFELGLVKKGDHR